jgi:hypothetical protein
VGDTGKEITRKVLEPLEEPSPFEQPIPELVPAEPELEPA